MARQKKNTIGGLQIGGNIRITGGDFVGGDKNLRVDKGAAFVGGDVQGSHIVTGNHNQICSQALRRDDLFAEILENIAQRPETPTDDKNDLKAHHIKSFGYFLKVDVMGTCRVPESVYYSHDKQGNALDVRYENAVIIVMRKNMKAMRASSGDNWMGDPLSFQKRTMPTRCFSE